jgi:esterase/lipase superfamily enzyme
MARWGHFGTPVLIFPTGGGDFEEIERFQLIGALAPLIDQGRIKAYSVDGISARAWLSGNRPPQDCARLEDAYDTFISEEALQRIRTDCKDPRIEPIMAGAALGAFFAISGICRHPTAFRAAIGLSGIYDLARVLGGVSGQQVGAYAPIEALPKLAPSRLEQLRHRQISLGCGRGDYETPAETQRLAAALAASTVPCKLTLQGPEHAHTWSTWREMLPAMLAQLL